MLVGLLCPKHRCVELSLLPALWVREYYRWKKIEILRAKSCNFVYISTVPQCVSGSVLLNAVVSTYMVTWASVGGGLKPLVEGLEPPPNSSLATGLITYTFCRVAYDVVQCPSVMFVHSVKMNKHVFKSFLTVGQPHHPSFSHQMLWQYSDGASS